MATCSRAEVAISGVGVTSAIGQGKAAFMDALLRGEHAFRVMQRPGRQRDSAFLGAEIDTLQLPSALAPQLVRAASFSGQAALATLHEAWTDAHLSGVAPERIGLVVGGSNVQQRDHARLRDQYSERFKYIPPSYGLSFTDADLCGLCTEQFPIRAFAHTLGAASASGQAAVIHAAQSVAAGFVDVCIAIGALADVSYWECQALRSMGAMGSDRYADEPALACRPFDASSDGFIYGEACGAVVVERADAALERGVAPYAQMSGWATVIDGNRGPSPSLAGENGAIDRALSAAGVAPHEIDYVKPHGTGSALGDAIESQAIRACDLTNAYVNTTKSLIGHGLSAAGAVELVAAVLQMQRGVLHPSRNLDDPVAPDLRWVRDAALAHDVRRALALSAGFGGINTAVCLTRMQGR